MLGPDPQPVSRNPAEARRAAEEISCAILGATQPDARHDKAAARNRSQFFMISCQYYMVRPYLLATVRCIQRLHHENVRTGAPLPVHFPSLSRDFAQRHSSEVEIGARIQDIDFLGIGLVQLKMDLAKYPTVSIARKDRGEPYRPVSIL